ncbi:GumC family protein [Moorena bouillonii]|uniref:GumC family protein n=1 Tax=Moorena bouillonii TaxID=207920 RepID=UPI000A7D76C0|nr:polysaccharide biosynthesis tyrosine autokinase [Moorena bouillonii]
MINNFSPSPLPVASNNGNFPPLPQGSPWLEPDDSEWDLARWFVVVQRRGLVIVGVTVAGMSYVYPTTLNEEPIYQSKFRILVEPVNAANDLDNLTSVLGPQNLKSGLDYETQIQVLRSPELMKLVVAELQKTHPEISYNSLIKDLSITRLGKTKILEISYQGKDPDLILTILNQLANVYLEYSLAERQTNLKLGIQFIENQLPSRQARVNQLQNQLQVFRERYQFTDPESQAQLIASQMTTLKQQNLALEQELVQARSYLGSLQEETGALAALGEAPLYQQIIGQLRSVETQIAGELTRFQPQSTAIQLLQTQRQNLLPVLEQEAERVLNSKFAEGVTEVQRLETQRQTLFVAQQQLNQQAQQIPALARRYTDLQLEIQIATEGLNRFRSTQETLQIQAAQTEIPWEVIEDPVRPVLPISPNIPRSLTLGAVASIAVGIGLALVWERLDNVNHTLDELKQQTKLPVLGTIPVNKKLPGAPSTNSLETAGRFLFKPFTWVIPGLKKKSTAYSYGNDTEFSHFLESIRVLNTNIKLLSSDRPMHSVAISSSTPGDGKSTISLFLAQTAAAMGKKVLLVDADMRKPQVHRRLNLSNQSGLSNLIAQSLSPEEVFNNELPIPRLSVLTAGKIPPDPTKLLSSEKMKQLIKYFEEIFDLVIYDTPPVLGLADASLLAPSTNGLILVTRIGKTDRSALTQALDNLKLSRVNVLGIVANGVQGDANSPYGYYKSAYGNNHKEEAWEEEENLTSTFSK